MLPQSKLERWPEMRAINASELMKVCGETLGVPNSSGAIDLVKPALRRAAFLLAPCSSTDLIGFVSEPLTVFGDIREIVEESLSEMITYGDILEMKRLQSDPWDAPSYLLRPAPPSFVLRSNGEAIILGISGELPSALTAELDANIQTGGPVRVLRTDIDSLPSQLKLLGFTQLSEQAWLRVPTICASEVHAESWRDQLAKQPISSGLIEGLEILDGSRPGSYYRGRWREPDASHTGSFVARRSQQYGAKLWSFIALEKGVPVKILDLHGDNDWHRPCDLAWRLQAAIDAECGSPQRFAVRYVDADAYFDFKLPIPAFAERRLALVASKTTAQGALFRFRMPGQRAKAEITALSSTLWMQPLREEETR